jgi:hypothetical protein
LLVVFGVNSSALPSLRGWLVFDLLSNVKEHATLAAGARVDHVVNVEVTKGHVNRAADRGCVSLLVVPLR